MATNNPTLQQAANLQGTLIRKGGQIFEQAPTTPDGVESQGGTPAQVAAAGTPNQKQPILEQAVAAEVQAPTAVQAPRQLGEVEGAKAEQKQETAAQLGQFQNFNERVNKLVQSKFQAVQGTQAKALTVEEALNQAFAQNTAIQVPNANGQVQTKTVNELVQEFAANPADETPLTLLSQALSASGTYVDPMQIKQWLDTGETAVGSSAATTISDNVMMGDFNQQDYQSLGFESPAEVAGVLGIDESALQGMTLQQFQKAVEQKKQAMFEEVQNLRAELQNAPPGSAYARQLQQKIADLTGAGVTTTEQRMKELVETLNTADEIRVGDSTIPVEDLLKDDNVSDLVVRYLAAPPTEREKIIPSGQGFDEFKQWVLSNKELLGGLAQQMQTTAETFKGAQEKVRGLVNQLGGDPRMVETVAKLAGVDIPKLGQMTSAQVSQLFDKLDDQPAFQLFANNASDFGLTEGQKGVLLKDLRPEDVAAMAGKNAQEIVKGWKRAQEVAPGSLLSDLLGETGKFIVDDGAVAAFDEAKKVVSQLAGLDVATQKSIVRDPGMVDLLKQGKVPPEVLSKGNLTVNGQPIFSDPQVKALLSSGALTKDNANLLEYAEDVINKMRPHGAQQRALAAAPDIDRFIDVVFGKDVNVDEIDQNYRLAQQFEKMGDPAAKARVESMAAGAGMLDANRDGYINSQDLPGLKHAASTGGTLSMMQAASEGRDFVSPFYTPQGQANVAQLGKKYEPSGVYKDILDMLGGGFSPQEQEILAQHPDWDKVSPEWKKNYGFKWQSTKDYDNYVTGKRAEQAKAAVAAPPPPTRNFDFDRFGRFQMPENPIAVPSGGQAPMVSQDDFDYAGFEMPTITATGQAIAGPASTTHAGSGGRGPKAGAKYAVKQTV